MTAPDDRNPLARAVDEAGDGPEARAFSVPVEAVRAGARRRRARRTGVTSGLAVLVVAAVAGGTYAALPGRGGPDLITHPGPQGPGVSSAAADWPAQFERCGQRAGESLPNVGEPMTLTLVNASSSIAAVDTWNASVIADVPTAPPGQVAVVWATDLSVVRDGIVVGVQEGPTAPPLSEPLNQRPEGLLTNPFPVTTKVREALASCDQFPSGQGSPVLAPGTYTLVVTQTVSYASPGAVQALTDVRSSVLTTVTVTASETPASADPTACGAQVEPIAALVSMESNPAPIQLTVDFHPTPGPSYSAYPVGPRLTNMGTAELVGVTSEPTVVAVRDGVVVGRAQRSSVRTDLGRLVPGGAFEYADPPFAERCPGTPEPAWEGGGLPAGDYELWVVVDVGATSPEVAWWQAAAGPIPWTVSEPSSIPPPTSNAQPTDPVDALFPCGQHPTVTSDTLPDVTPLRLTATIPRDGWADGVNVPDWSTVLSASAGATVQADVNRFVYLAFVDDHGTVVGRTGSGDGVAIEAATIGGGLTYMQTGYGFPVACAPDGTLGAAGSYATIAPGTYTAWPYALVTVRSVSGPNLPSEVTAFRGDTVVVGVGLPVRFTGP